MGTPSYLSLGWALARTLRPQQWAKNALLFVPALAAHVPWNLPLVKITISGFLAFSALASAVYILNDLVDRPFDQSHPTKRSRPIASGQVSLKVALGTAVTLLGVAFLLSAALPPAFRGVLVAYLVLTTAYSVVIKRRIIMDVITLASLYALRIVAGSLLAEVPLSRWFLAFSVFLFFSLALVKRVTEILECPNDDVDTLGGRGYRPTDLPVLLSLGSAAISASCLVFCLYVTGEEAARLYKQPDFLWLGLPVLLYWQARLWVLAHRNAIAQDPVAFALKDRATYLLGISFFAIVWLAT